MWYISMLNITSASIVFKLCCAQGFCILMAATLKNRSWSPILQIDLETYLVHNHGEYRQASFEGFEVRLNAKSSCTDWCTHARTNNPYIPKNNANTTCCVNVVPASWTVDQHWSIGSMCRVCWVPPPSKHKTEIVYSFSKVGPTLYKCYTHVLCLLDNHQW